MRTVLMTEDGPELLQLVDGALVWPPIPFMSSSPTRTEESLNPRLRLEQLYEILVGQNTIRVVSAKCARSDEPR
jgi:hypothetical protein